MAGYFSTAALEQVEERKVTWTWRQVKEKQSVYSLEDQFLGTGFYFMM